MAGTTTSSIPYFFRRGGVWWWRRRLPSLPPEHASSRPGAHRLDPGRTARPTLALSLRTACRDEARRRGARLAACFEDAVAARRARMDDGAQQAGFARDLLALLRDQVAQMAAQQAASSAALARQTELSLALVNQLNAPAVAPALRETAVAPCAAASAPVPVRGAAIDDPEMEAALLAQADREGWWDDDAEEVLEQFDWMLVGLITLQGEYVRYCARKGLDPTTALPSIARLAAKLEETATATGAAAAGPEATDVRHAPPTSASPAAMPDCARSMDRTPGSPRAPTQAAPGEATRRRSNLLVSEIFERYLAMRMTGCKVDPEREVPSPKIGAKFAQTMRPNIEGTQRPIVEILGDRPLEALGAVEWKTFVDTLPRVPRNHGTSSRDKRNRPSKAACTPPS